MKIGIDIRVLLDKYYSGIPEYVYNLLLNILEQDQDNEYYLFYNSWHKVSLPPKLLVYKNVHIINTSYPNKVFNYILQKIFSYPKIDKVLGGVDVFWSPHFNFTSLNKNTRNILTVHDLSFLRYPHFFSWRKNFWHKALNIQKSIRRADMIVAVSENTKNDLIELMNISQDRVRIIYSGNKGAESVNHELALKRLKEWGINKEFILYLGNIEPRKNITGLIKAYNQLREKAYNYNLVLAGSLGWKKDKIISAWKESKYKEDIKFLHYVNQQEKSILYSQAKVFVYPSYYEGFGFPPLEAMSYNLPVVCSNVSSLPEIVSQAAIMVNPYSFDSISRGIREILDDRKIEKYLINQGQQQIKKFSWSKTAQKYIDLFLQT